MDAPTDDKFPVVHITTSDGGPRVAMFYDVDRRLKAVDLFFLVRAGM